MPNKGILFLFSIGGKRKKALREGTFKALREKIKSQPAEGMLAETSMTKLVFNFCDTEHKEYSSFLTKTEAREGIHNFRF
ncbi:hypothetical protein D3C87_1826760 [compost metagenome]